MINYFYYISNDSEFREAAGDSEQIAEYLEYKNLNIKNFNILTEEDSDYLVYTSDISSKKLLCVSKWVDINKLVLRFQRRHYTEEYYSIYGRPV